LTQEWQVRERLRRARLRTGLSVAQFAAAVHFSPAYVYAIESGSRPPTDAYILAVVAYTRGQRQHSALAQEILEAHRCRPCAVYGGVPEWRRRSTGDDGQDAA
jgi:predicted transcriptional regulator